MPLTGNYEWQEKKDVIQIQIPLKGVSPAKVDIFGNTLSTCVEGSSSKFLIMFLFCLFVSDCINFESEFLALFD